jgi:TDG/mug DNA glycosylase family protein
MGDKSAKPWKPTKKDLSAAHNKRVPDIVAPGLKVLFVGINPGLYSAAVGRHFARPGNRFWPALYEAGFTDRRLSPFEEQELLSRHIGITNIVERASAAADHLTAEELLQGARRLGKKIDHYRPKVVAFLGLTAYRAAFSQPKAKLGEQDERLAGSLLWLLPNPSGLNAHFQARDFARLFRELKDRIDTGP